MPKTIKECLEDVANFYSNREFTLDGEDYKGVDTALAEIRQVLKEAEPKKLKESDHVLNMGVVTNPPSNTTRTNLTRKGYNSAIEQYTANIEKRLG